MTRLPISLVLAALAVAAAGGFLAHRSAEAARLRAEREEARDRLAQALELAGRQPARFGQATAPLAADGSLKPLAQELAAARQVSLGYLSETERDAEGGRRERQLVLRLVQAPHPNLVRFLEDLERRGSGARVKELHLRPSRDLDHAYEEAEVVLARPAGGKSP